MFGSSLFGGLQGLQGQFDDPFFRDMQETHQRHMNTMGMGSMFATDPFMMQSMAMMPPAQALQAPGRGVRSRELQPHMGNPRANPMGMMMSPFGMMDSMFGDMNSMMGNMHRNMERMANDPNTHSYSSSSVMSFSNTGDGAPQYYQASSSTRQAPGGVRETRKTERDSHRGVEKMAIGHHIGEKSHVIEKSKNTRSGDMEEKQDFVNIDETDADSFNQEWKQRTGAGSSRGGGFSVAGRSRPTMAAISDGREYRHDREYRSRRHHDEPDLSHSVHFNQSERSSDDARPVNRRPTPTTNRPKGPSKGGRQRDY